MVRLLVATTLAGVALAAPARADMSLSQYQQIKRGEVDIVSGDEALFYLGGVLDGVRTANVAASQSGIALFCVPPETDLSLGGLDDLIERHIQEVRESRADAQAYLDAVSVGTALLIVLNRDFPCRFEDEGEGTLPDLPGLPPRDRPARSPLEDELPADPGRVPQ